MSSTTVILAPLALLLPVAGAVDPARPAVEITVASVSPEQASPVQLTIPAAPEPRGFESQGVFRIVSESFRIESRDQVRIEQRVTIRVAPRPAPVRPNMLMDMPQHDLAPRLVERGMGKCLPVSGIAGVQVSDDNRLLLFMRDHRMVSAALERACRARDFYSGFYLERNGDGQLCVDRDTLLSRSGANCKLTRFRQLVNDDD